MKKTKIINLFGGPGIGKSTLAAMLFAKLKMGGCDCELITEFAKKLTWHKRHNSLACQPYVFGKQLHEIYNVYGQVDYIITDSPILLSAMYTDLTKWPNSFINSVVDIYKSFDNINYFIKRTKKYNPNGRNQSLEEAKEIDENLYKFLCHCNIQFNETFSNEQAANEIIERLKTNDRT